MKKILFLIIAILMFLVGAFAWSPDAIIKENTLTSITNCPYTINYSGIYLLANNLSSNVTCITINTSNVELNCQGYTIDGTDAPSPYTYGIFYQNPHPINNVTIKNCILTDWRGGIWLRGSNSGLIENISADSNSFGIYISGSNNNIINNIVKSNNEGIVISSGSNNQIINNIANSNVNSGIGISGTWSTTNNSIINNNFNSNGYGIKLMSIFGDAPINNTVTGNMIYNSSSYGIAIFGSVGEPNLIYNNYFNNPVNAYSDSVNF